MVNKRLKTWTEFVESEKMLEFVRVRPVCAPIAPRIPVVIIALMRLLRQTGCIAL